jgi:hypothetical protein
MDNGISMHPCVTTVVRMVDEAKLKKRYEAFGQGHVFKHLADLSDSDKESFLKQLDGIKVESLESLLEAAKNMSHAASKPRGDGTSGECQTQWDLL